MDKVHQGRHEFKVYHETIHGSKLYGIDYKKGEFPLDPEYCSDSDYKGLFVLTHEQVIDLFNYPEVIETKCPENDSEYTHYELRKFLTLCAKSNPNIFDQVFARPDFWTVTTEVGKTLHDRRHTFVSRLCADSYMGYFKSQMKRIQGHNTWLNRYPDVNAVVTALRNAHEDEENSGVNFNWLKTIMTGSLAEMITGETATETSGKPGPYSLSEIVMRYSEEKIDNIELYQRPDLSNFVRLTDFYNQEIPMDAQRMEWLCEEAASRAISKTRFFVYEGGRGVITAEGAVKTTDNRRTGEPVGVMTLAKPEYDRAVNDFNSLWKWRTSRNADRATLEEMFGYDTKHGAHAIRLLRNGIQLLTHGEYDPRLEEEDRDLLKGIREGRVSFEEFNQIVDESRETFRKAEESTKLKEKVTLEEINKLYMELMEASR